ncbi:MAG: SDR family oxidoreductase [Gammaproteobacteria bacterium]|nr:SDR family oxidoreductase [Gammaproteobacteria bacterium]
MGESPTALVTGASSGIGYAVCQRLLELGYQTIGVARDFTKLPDDGGAFHRGEIDLSKLDELPAHLDALTTRYPDVDAIIFCAGAGRFGSLEEFSYTQIKSLVNLNLTSQIYVARAFLPIMKRRRRGDLIFIGSEAGLTGGRRGAVYSATKFALRGLAQSLRDECAASRVRVSIINPGMVKTAFFDDLDFGPGESEDNYIEPCDVAAAVESILVLRSSTVIDEINLSPLKKVIRAKQRT